MGRLEYDDSAFVYFAIGIGTCFLLPVTLSFLLSVWRAVNGSKLNVKPRSEQERVKLAKLEKESGLRKVWTRSFGIKLGLLLLGWGFVLYFVTQAGDASEIQQFDPWEVLGLDSGVSENVVKKAYRKRSFEYHPDRNRQKSPDDQAYAEMMMAKVQNAHHILTNKEAYDLFLSTGSADGSKQMEVSIGLPKFLLQKENHNLVLVVYLIILVVVLPVSVGSWYSNSKIYGDKLILNDTYNVYLMLLLNGSSTPLPYMPEVLALSAEFRSLPARGAADEACLAKLRSDMRADNRMAPTLSKKVAELGWMQQYPSCERALVLIHVYLNRLTEELTPGLVEDLEEVLAKSKMLLLAMSETVTPARKLRAIRTVLAFEQHITQALWIYDSSLQQLPHYGPLQAKHASLGKNALKGMADFLKAPDVMPGRKKGMSQMTDAQVAEVGVVAALLPRVDFNVTLGVVAHELPDGGFEFEHEMCEGDIMTASFVLTRSHVEEAAKGASSASARPEQVHAPYLPAAKEESWSVLFCKHQDNTVFGVVPLRGGGRVLRGKTQFPSKGFIKPNATYNFDFFLVSHDYLDFDQLVTEKVRILPEGTVKPKPLHQEDQDIDAEPTLLEEAFGRVEVESDSDFADSDDETEPGDERQTKQPQAQPQAQARARPGKAKPKPKPKPGAKKDDLLADDFEEISTKEATEPKKQK